MLEAPLRIASVVFSVLVLLGFGLFAIDEARSASQGSVAVIGGAGAGSGVDPTPAQEAAREATNGSPREAIDDANDVLLAPFAVLTSDDANEWAARGIPALVALLLYGFGLGFLARFARA